ncbi:MAG: putative copper resistance protein [Frankiales bacterium]|nr:putative copper resistance protein [Frankiales bacterium]
MGFAYSNPPYAGSLADVRDFWIFVGTWNWDPTVVVPLLATGLAYLWCCRIVSRSHPSQRWPVCDLACFLAGLASIWLVLIGPIGCYDDTFFWSHMVQHMVLMMLAGPLIVLGSPVLLLLRVCSRQVRRQRVLPVLRSRAAVLLTDPVLTWLAFAGVLVGTHFSPFYNFALTHEWAHRFIEHPLYLGVSVIYYYSVIGDNPLPRERRPSLKVISLGLMMVPEAMTGFFLYASPYVLYPHYAQVSRPFGPSALTDQQLGGSLMWAGGMLLDTAFIALATREWLRHDARKTRRIDLVMSRVSHSPVRTTTR